MALVKCCLVCGLREEGDVSEGVTHGILHEECEALQNEAADNELGSPVKLFLQRSFPKILAFNGRRESQQIAAIWGACMAIPEYVSLVHSGLASDRPESDGQKFLDKLIALAGEQMHFPDEHEFKDLVRRAWLATRAR